MKNVSKKAWGGRFKTGSHALLEEFNASLGFDRRLYRQDIEGSLAHAAMLKKIGVLTTAELAKITKGLKSIQKEIEQDKFVWDVADEDIHMAIEKRLTQKIGKLGGKLHTARSRNDQVATDLRLYVRWHVEVLVQKITSLQKAFVNLADKKGFVAMPGYTHLQRAQPVYLAHHLMAYFEMLARDKQRLLDAQKRLNQCPLGSGALAGSTFKLDRTFVAKKLKFDDVTHNSLDAVSDRDFVAEVLFAISLLMAHLSRFAEELILWSSQEFDFIKLPEAFCTGSSMMPQKMNPDIPELVRGKTGRVYGNLVALLTVIKGLPLAYNKDLQEDKEPLFDSLDTIDMVLNVLNAMVPGLQVNKTKMSQALEEGFLLATDLADYLASKNVAFRKAHEIVGRVVQYGLENNKTLESMSVGELKKFSAKIGPDVKKWLSVEASLNRRKSTGGTAAAQVKKEINRAKRSL